MDVFYFLDDRTIRPVEYKGIYSSAIVMLSFFPDFCSIATFACGVGRTKGFVVEFVFAYFLTEVAFVVFLDFAALGEFFDISVLVGFEAGIFFN